MLQAYLKSIVPTGLVVCTGFRMQFLVFTQNHSMQNFNHIVKRSDEREN